MSQADDICQGAGFSNAPENNSFIASFIHLGRLGREGKEDYMKVGESKVGIGLQDS